MHQPRPVSDPRSIFDQVQEQLEAWAGLHSAALVSVLETTSGSTAISVLADGVGDAVQDDAELDAALRAAIEVLEPEFGEEQ
jgi:hypothetical protein